MSRRLGALVQTLVLGVLLGLGSLQLWALAVAQSVPPDPELAKKGEQGRVFRYQAY